MIRFPSSPWPLSESVWERGVYGESGRERGTMKRYKKTEQERKPGSVVLSFCVTDDGSAQKRDNDVKGEAEGKNPRRIVECL